MSRTAKDAAPRVAIVTGGSRGIGRDTVLRLASRGVRTIFTFKSNRVEADALVALTKEAGVPAIALELDTGAAASFDGFIADVRKALDTMGVDHFDFLVNNAGISSTASFVTGTESELDIQFAVPNATCRIRRDGSRQTSEGKASRAAYCR